MFKLKFKFVCFYHLLRLNCALRVINNDTITEPSGPPALNDMIRDAEFWMEDGSVVLAAGRVAFRVYKGLLGAQSPIFKQLFADSKPSAEEMLEGCPVVALSDPPEAVRHFLRALIHKDRPLFFRAEDDPKIPVDELFAVARLAHKYEVDDLLRQTISCFRTYYTTSFDVWNTKGQSGDVPFEVSQEESPFYAIGVINLARLTNNPSMLPLAFYDCSSLGGKVVNGWRCPDGTVEHLSSEDLKRCFDGCIALVNRATRRHSKFLDSTYCMSLKQVSSCKSALLAMKQKLDGRVVFARGEDALHSFMQLASLKPHLSGICESCSRALFNADLAARRTIWAEIPSLFALTVDGWETATR